MQERNARHFQRLHVLFTWEKKEGRGDSGKPFQKLLERGPSLLPEGVQIGGRHIGKTVLFLLPENQVKGFGRKRVPPSVRKSLLGITGLRGVKLTRNFADPIGLSLQNQGLGEMDVADSPVIVKISGSFKFLLDHLLGGGDDFAGEVRPVQDMVLKMPLVVVNQEIIPVEVQRPVLPLETLFVGIGGECGLKGQASAFPVAVIEVCVFRPERT